MPTEMLLASARGLRRGAVAGPVVAAAVLAALTVPVLDDGYALQVLRGVGVVLGLAIVVAVDDPAGVVLAASPYSAVRRTLARLAAVVAVAAPVWLATAAVVASRASDVPVAGVALETAAWWGAALALAATVWRRTGSLAASYVAGPVLLGLALASDALPRAWALLAGQTWGPPWEAAQIRWVAVLLAGAAVVSLALRDPLDRA